MHASRYTDSQILAILKQSENGVPVPELCHEHGMSSDQFYKWRAKFAPMILRLKELEDESKRFRKMYAEIHIKANVREKSLSNHLAAKNHSL